MNKNKITHWATINPELLKWAREKSALSFSEISSKTNIESESVVFIIWALIIHRHDRRITSKSLTLKMIGRFRVLCT
jgi:hypothetical protein